MNELDRFFKEKLENRLVEFDEAHWREAEKLLDQRDKKKRPIWLWWTALGTFLLIGGLWWALAGNQHSAEDVDSASEKTPQQVIKNTTVSPSQLDQAKAPVANPQHIAQAEKAVEEALAPGAVNKEQLVESRTDKLVDLTPETKIFEQASSQKGVGEPPVIDQHKSLDEMLRNQETSENKTELAIVEEPYIPATPQADLEDAIVENKPSEPQANAAWANPDFLPLLALNLIDIPQNEFKISDPYKIKTPLRLSLGIQGMLAVYPGFQTGKTQIMGSTTGVVFRLSGPKKWGFRSGLNYRVRTGHYNLTDSLTEVAYSFGRLEKQYSLTPRSVHFLELPLLVSYQAGRHEIQAGAQLGYLMGVKGQLEVPLDGIPLRRNIETGWMDKTGFKNIKMDLSLAYHFAITKHWKAGVYAHYTPLDWVEKANSASNILQEDGKLWIDLGFRFDLF